MKPRRFVRTLAAVTVLGAVGLATTVPASGQEATDSGASTDETPALPQSYLDGFGWWSKAQQNPAGGQNPGAPVPVGTNCTPTDANTCPAGPPADGMYVVYDYEAVAPTAVTGPISNTPTIGAPPPPDGAPLPNASTPTPIGPLAYSAVRYIVPEGAETEFSVHILSRSSTQPGGVDPSTIGSLIGCMTATPGWAAVQNGRYDQGPKWDCSGGAVAELTGDTATFKFPASMVQNGTLDVVILGTGDKPFQMSFSPPTDSALLITNADELAPVEEFTEEDYSLEDPISEFSAPVEDLPVDTGLSSDVAFSSEDSFGSVATAPVPRALPQRAVTAGKLVSPFSPDASRGERIMAVALLLLMGLALWWIGGQPARAPRLLGSLAGDQPQDASPSTVHGIGRFARPRHGRPPRLY